MLAENSDGTVHGGDFGVALAQDFALRSLDLSAGVVGCETNFFRAVFRWQIVIQCQICRQAAVGFVRGAEPNDGEEWFAILAGGVDEADGFADDDLRAFARKNLWW